MKATFSILITTKNRIEDLLFTLSKIEFLLHKKEMQCIICDDGSTDGTYNAIASAYPQIKIIRNESSKGLIFSRNRMMNMVKTDFAISIDDDLHFMVQEPLEYIEKYFEDNSKCAVQSFRIFWSKKEPATIGSAQTPHVVKSFAGGAHVWNMKAWNAIPDYPDWFVFYGEEDFAAYQLFKKGWEVHYVPAILVNHRVDIKQRKSNSDYQLRTRRSFRAAWYLYFMFQPWSLIPRKLAYSLWTQLKLKTFRGDWKASLGLFQAIGDVIVNMPKLIQQSNRFSEKEFQDFSTLAEVKLYWKPEDEK